MNLPDTLSYCARLARSGDHDRFLSCLFAPAPVREHLFTLYAFNLEVARIGEMVSEPMLGEIRLQWWREAIDGAYGHSEPRAHPVAQALSQTIRQCALPRQPFDALIDARALDLAPMPPATLTALEQYARDTSSGLMRLASAALSPVALDPAVQQAIDHAGVGVALCGLIRSIGFHAGLQRVYLPLDLLLGYGLEKQQLLARRVSGPLRQVIRLLAEAAVAHLTAAQSVAPPRVILPALLPASLARLYLPGVFADDFDPFRVVPPLPAFRRQISLLRAMILGRL